MPVTHSIDDALDQLRPMLDAYRDGRMSMTEITNWLGSYEAGLDQRDATWAEAARRIHVLLSEVESGYGTKASIHHGLEAIARDCRPLSKD
ncbi:MAG TPA: hypothetical protein VGL99_23605 [Chloroflexota bacterium]|jgi:hypothetical protein